VWQQAPYDLEWLADSLDMEPYKDKRRHLPTIGLGRNCTLFEVTRRFGYTHKRACPERELFDGIHAYAGHYNESRFTYPLPLSEVRATARSVTKWVIRRMDDEGFLDWCHRRARFGNKKSQDVRAAQAADKAAAIKAYYDGHPDVTREELSNLFDVSEFTLKSLSLGMAESRKQARQAKSQDRAAQAKTLYAEGKTQKQIAVILGLNQSQISRLLKS
jgi:hypothetical protein